MGNILSAINDDMDEYCALCDYYKEPVQTTTTKQGVALPDCYGEHAHQLQERKAAEKLAERTQ